MNELLRVLDRVLKPTGYRLRKVGRYHLLPVREVLEGLDEDSLRGAADAFNRVTPRENDDCVSRLIVCVRTSLRADRIAAAQPRLGERPLDETMLRCLSSLARSIRYANTQPANSQSWASKPELRIVVFDDRSDAPYRDRIEAVLATSGVPVELRTTHVPGQGPSMHEQFAWGAEQDALLYFCEEDYLHEDSAIAEFLDFYGRIFAETGRHMVLHPQESVTCYKRFYPSYLLRTDFRHWRSTSHMTHTLLTHGRVVRDYWRYFENTRFVGNRKKRRLGAESRTTNLLFRHVPGFCPIPPLAVHFQFEGTLPPFYDWRPLWQRTPLPD